MQFACLASGSLAAKYRLGRSLFLPANRFWPSYAKSRPIWIRFCTRLLLYGIVMWADLDRDRRVGGSRPNQNDCFCKACNCKAPQVTTDRCDFGANRQSAGEDGCYCETFRNFVTWAEPNKTHIFAFLGYPSNVLRTDRSATYDLVIHMWAEMISDICNLHPVSLAPLLRGSLGIL